VRYADGHVPTADLRLQMQKTMQNNAAVFRTGDVLKEGCDLMQGVYDSMVRSLYTVFLLPAHPCQISGSLLRCYGLLAKVLALICFR